MKGQTRMLDNQELDARIELVRKMQTRIPGERKPQPTNKQSRMLRRFKQIDRKHAVPKIRYFPQERRYAFPANIGNAVNPLVFGKIPLAYQLQEMLENARANHAAQLKNTNHKAWQKRVKSMNYKHY